MCIKLLVALCCFMFCTFVALATPPRHHDFASLSNKSELKLRSLNLHIGCMASYNYRPLFEVDVRTINYSGLFSRYLLNFLGPQTLNLENLGSLKCWESFRY